MRSLMSPRKRKAEEESSSDDEVAADTSPQKKRLSSVNYVEDPEESDEGTVQKVKI
jgi:hypothetical protein